MGGSTQSLKQKAGSAAVEFVQSGMVVGLGTGSTAIWAVRRLAELIDSKKLAGIVAVPTSAATEAEARKLKISLTSLEAHPSVDLTIDGADEVDPNLNLIKGAGGALLREKIVAQASRRLMIAVDESKLSLQLGQNRPVPVEVVRFGWKTQQQFLEDLGASVCLRIGTDEKMFVTDQGNYILDCRFGPIHNVFQLSAQLNGRTGIVEHGLFVRMTTDLIVAGSKGIDHRKAIT
ncbi:MAG: ribose-5-phosphate isomerase RpiA [Desulfobacterales bacterium]|nr:ribose-5-phosphate isomerase RpiA [Desulfobacterales bacterium]MCF8079950.1 ribose-5-phosphate isomerase RpiA [Desulfobacterales bacterium]